MTKTKAAARVPTTESDQIIKRVAALNWPRIFSELDAHGCAVIDSLLAPVQCAAIARMYPADEHFRSRVIMSRHGYGRGEYKYFVYPLPEVVAALRVLSIHPSPSLRTAGTRRWRSTSVSPRSTPTSSSGATRPARFARRRSSFSTAPAILIVCTKTCTASTSFRCRSPSS